MNLRDAPLGRKSFFSPEGKIALMFLKSYTNLSDFELIEQTNELNRNNKSQINLSANYQKRFSVIKKILQQEKKLFEGREVTDRIVSIDRYYLRPIVREKETKAVEFGAKVNNTR